MRVLMVEDKKSLADSVKNYLRSNKIDTTTENDGLEGYLLALKEAFDVLILDLTLPHKDGLAIIKDLRANEIYTPILVLSGRTSTHDKVQALLSGADDYMTKPFVLEELLARLFALTRRKGIIIPMEQEISDLTLDRLNHTLVKGEQTAGLTAKEFQIMDVLFQKGSNVVKKEDLVLLAWGSKDTSLYNSVEVYITFLRRKIKSLGSNVEIKSARNFGYYLKA